MGCTQSSAADTGKLRRNVSTANLAKGRITSIDETRTMTFGGVTVRYAYLSQRGYYPGEPDKNNQDSYSVTTKFAGRDTDGFFGVYDGHGEKGDQCSRFVSENLPSLLAAEIGEPDKKMQDDHYVAIENAHRKLNKLMHKSKTVDDDWSGTTSISMYLRGDVPKITVANVGDSRIIVGSVDPDKPSKVVATALSNDQTPWRRDERKRIQDLGGRIMTEDQLFGRAPMGDPKGGGGDASKPGLQQQWKSGRGLEGEKKLGDEIDESGQPPRVFSGKGDYPGLSLTRTVGDSVICEENIGVDATPEMMTRELTSEDKVVFLASDGVWEFMTNQKVMDMCTKYKDPLEACRQIQATSYNLWMKNDRRTDDITMIAIYIDEVKSPGASSAPIKPASIKPALLQSAVAHPGAGFIGTDKSNPVEKKPLPPDFNIEELIDCMKETCKATFGGVSVRYAHLSQRGYYPDDPNKNNQDSYSVTTPFADKKSDVFFGVYDGHGPCGDQCSQYVRQYLPKSLAQQIGKSGDTPEAFEKAHEVTSTYMNSSKTVKNEWSGSTAISVYLRGDKKKITVSNVGDSRAILGSIEDEDSSKIVATALSNDQTPWRRDERKRIQDLGGRILNEEQLLATGNQSAEGTSDNRPGMIQTSLSQQWKSGRGLEGEMKLGEEVDDSGDPPRVFSPNGDYPGLSLTRALGDKTISDENVGVIPLPELLTRELLPEDKIIFLATDGVWEFITNQTVIDICSECNDPVEACRIIQAKSFDAWLENDTRTDDITMICIYIDEVK